MSPRSRTNLSELTIDSKSEPPSNLQTTHEEPELAKDPEDDKVAEVEHDGSFFNHDETVIPAHDEDEDEEEDEDDEDDDQPEGEEDEDILAGLYATGLNSIPSIHQPSPSQPKMRPKKNRKPFQHRESLKNVDVLKYIDAKMNHDGSGPDKQRGGMISMTPMTNGHAGSNGKGSSHGPMTKGGESYQYCEQLMQADSIKPFNSGNDHK